MSEGEWSLKRFSIAPRSVATTHETGVEASLTMVKHDGDNEVVIEKGENGEERSKWSRVCA